MTRGGPAVPFSPPELVDPELVEGTGEGPGRGMRGSAVTRPKLQAKSPSPLRGGVRGGGGTSKLDAQKDKAALSPESFRPGIPPPTLFRR
jgi:hypothetical protein